MLVKKYILMLIEQPMKVLYLKKYEWRCIEKETIYIIQRRICEIDRWDAVYKIMKDDPDLTLHNLTSDKTAMFDYLNKRRKSS